MAKEQARKHLDEVNGINTEPELVAVVQYDEGKDEVVVLLNNETIENGGEVTYKGKKFPVEVEIFDVGEVPDEIDHSKVDHYISTEAWDKKAKTIVTTSEAVYATKPGRTVVDADLVLSVGGVNILQQPDDAGKGSYVVCDKDVVLRRWRFVIPNTVWGSKPAKRSLDID